MSPRKICVVQQSNDCGPGRIADILSDHEVAWQLCKAGGGEKLPRPRDTAGIILLGGPMSVNDALPFLAGELRLIDEALRHGVPLLGICLGAQLLAKGLGSPVYRNPIPEIGWLPVSPTSEASGDPVLGQLRQNETVLQWHGETFDLPRGAAHLAASRDCTMQGFRFGRSVYGIQFHPEVNAKIIRNWVESDGTCGRPKEATAPIDPQANDFRCNELAHVLLGGWLDLVRGLKNQNA